MKVFSRALTNLFIALGAGYILFFFSERLFWTVLWPGTAWPDLTITWLAYSAAAYLFLAVVRWSRANDLPSVFMAGSIYGWLIEGGIANTLYGTQSSAPFPMSISLTALSWHALISVVVGWWAMKRALLANSVWPLPALSSAVGLFWGLWAMFPRQESPPIIVPVERFAAEAIVLTLLLAGSWSSVNRAALTSVFCPGWFGATISVLAIALFYVQHVLAIGARPLIMLPTLVGGALLVLSLHRASCGQVSDEHTRSLIPAPRLTVLLVMPVVATVTFGVATAAGWDRLPIAALVYKVTGLAGFGMLIISTTIIAWRRVISTDCCQTRRSGGGRRHE